MPPAEEEVSKHAAQARQLVLEAWPEIVRGLIKKAAGGGYQQAKLLLDVCSLANQDESSQNENQQLCDVLLEQLKLSPLRMEESGKNAADEKTDSKPYEA